MADQPNGCRISDPCTSKPIWQQAAPRPAGGA